MPRVPTPDRRDRETAKAHAAFADYCRMGVGRTLASLHRAYTEGSPEMKARAVSLRWLKEWSRKHEWQARVQDYDARMQAAADEEAEREMLEGLALPRERVRFIKNILEGMTPDEVRAALKASPATAAQIRGFLADLAAETGGRVQRTEATVRAAVGFTADDLGAAQDEMAGWEPEGDGP